MSDSTSFDEQAYDLRYIKRLLEANAQQAEENARLQAEVAAAKAILINHGYEENELRFMLEQVFEIAQQCDTANIRLDAESTRLHARIAELEAAGELLAERLKQYESAACIPPCDPQWDATDGACGCWWRGDDHGCIMTVLAVNDILDGKHRGGTYREPLEGLRRRLLAFREFARDCRDNFDHDEDAHRYNTPCRCCEAEKVLLPAAPITTGGQERAPVPRGEAAAGCDEAEGGEGKESLFKANNEPDTSDEDGDMQVWW